MSITTTAQYVPGPWVGMAGHRMWLVADLDPRDPVVGDCWSLVTAGASVDDVLTALLEGRLRPALNLAVVRLDEDGAEVLVRGEAWAEIARESTVDKPTTELRAGPGAFRDEKVDRFGVISLQLPDDAPDGDPPALALGTGVVPAVRIVIHASYPTQLADELSDEPADEPEPTGGRFVAMFGQTVHPTEAESGSAPVPEEWMAGMRRPAVAHADLSAGETLPPPHTLAGPSTMENYRSPFETPFAGGSEVLPSAPPTGPAAAGRDLFGDVSWAAVSDVPSSGPDPYEQYHVAHPAPTSYQPPAALQVPRPPLASTPTQPTPYPQAPLVSQPAGADGIDPELLRTVQRAPSTPVATGPVVAAVRCHLGHPNLPTLDLCRICGGAIPPQSPEVVVRPRLGVLRLSTGEVVPLDRGVILGRAPGVPEGFGRDEPYRIQLSSPDGSISRKHVEVVLQGWLVTVVDLDSTNGTFVCSPDGVPELLPPGARRVIDNGWTVSLDASTSFRFEVTE